MKNKWTNGYVKNKPITKKEYDFIMKSDYYLAQVILHTGVRINELHTLLNMNWDESMEIVYIHTKKSGKHKNSIILNEKARTALYKARKEYKGKVVRTLSRVFEKLGINAHRLRSTFSVNLHKNGVSVFTIQRLMNHADLSITSKYVMLDDSELITAVDTLCDTSKSLDGMTKPELQQEILRLRHRLNRIGGEKWD